MRADSKRDMLVTLAWIMADALSVCVATLMASLSPSPTCILAKRSPSTCFASAPSR